MDDTTMKRGKTGLRIANTALFAMAGYLAWANYLAPANVDAAPARNSAAQKGRSALEEKVERAPTPQYQTAQATARIDPRVESLTLDGVPAYKELIPTILDVSDKTGVPVDILALTVLVESRGEGGERHEPDFQHSYVDPLNKKKKGDRNYELAMTVEKMARLQIASGEIKDRATLERQLATSYGPAQIMYLVAVEQGFPGTAKELAQAKNSIFYSALRIESHKDQTGYDWEKVLRDYNTGKPNGTPKGNHLKRGNYYWPRLHRSR